MAEQRAEKLHAKLNYQPKADEEGKDEEQAVETFRKYEEELEINDFPQQARWKVTSKVRFKVKFLNIIFKLNFTFRIYNNYLIIYNNIKIVGKKKRKEKNIYMYHYKLGQELLTNSQSRKIK